MVPAFRTTRDFDCDLSKLSYVEVVETEEEDDGVRLLDEDGADVIGVMGWARG